MPAAAPRSLDWNDVRFFLAVARERTLARAAAALEVDQTTVGRRIAALEQRFGVALFLRSREGLSPTAAGERVRAAAERMEEAARDLTSEALAEGAPCAGTVRIATTETLAEAFVIPAVRDLRERHPGVSAVILTGFGRVDLRRGEADVAVRLVRPTDPRLACRKLGSYSLRLYASRAYVARRGEPTSLDGHALLAYEEAIRTAARHPFVNLPMDGGQLALTTNSGRLLVIAAANGMGIVELPSYVGEAIPELVRVLPDHEEPYSVWLVVPQATRRVAAVRAVCDAITKAFRQR